MKTYARKKKCTMEGRTLRIGLLLVIIAGTFLSLDLPKASMYGRVNQCAQPSFMKGEEAFVPYDICMHSDGFGCIVGWSTEPSGGGIVMHWDGTIWSAVPCPTDKRLFTVDIVDSSDGWAMGEPGAALRWNGTAWSLADSIDYYVYGLCMLDASNGWAVGGGWVGDDYGSKVLRWNGRYWREVTHPDSLELYGVSMLSADDGWAVGRWGSILCWNGTTWKNMTSPAGESVHLQDVSAVSSSDVWAVGYFGAIIHWNGTAWGVVKEPEDPGVNFTWLISVDMVDADDGWAVGFAGRIMHWNGSIWEDAPSPTTQDLLSVSMVNSTDGWAVGKGGTLLRWNGTHWKFPSACDLAVTNVEISKEVVGQGFTVMINTTLQNQGLFTETFNATIQANGKVISNLTNITMPGGSQKACLSAWNTTGWSKDNYSIAVYIPPLSGEVDKSDNVMVATREASVTISGDVDSDCGVDIYDIVRMCGVYGVTQPSPRYDANCDIDSNGCIDIYDIVIAAENYGRSWQSPYRRFETSVQANTEEGLSWYAVIDADGMGGVYVAWRHTLVDMETYEFSEHIFFVYSHDYGNTWSNGTMISDNASSSVRYSTPSLVVDKNNGYIYVAWLDNRTGRTLVYVDKSTDRGSSFGSDVEVNDNNGTPPPTHPGGMYWVNVAVADDGKVYLVWEDQRANPLEYKADIYVASSEDFAATFGSNVRVNPCDNASCHRFPWIATDRNGVVFVAYTKTYSLETWNLYVARSLDEGLSFEPPAKVNDDSTGGYRGKKEIGVSSSGIVYVAWTDGRAGSGVWYWDIYLAASLDGGLTFGPNVRVNDDPFGPVDDNTVQGTPSIAVDSNDGVHLVWEDFRNWGATPTHMRDIYHSYSPDGTTCSKNTLVNSYPSATYTVCADPNLGIDGENNLYVLWSDQPQGAWYLYFAFSKNLLS